MVQPVDVRPCSSVSPRVIILRAISVITDAHAMRLNIRPFVKSRITDLSLTKQSIKTSITGRKSPLKTWEKYMIDIRGS